MYFKLREGAPRGHSEPRGFWGRAPRGSPHRHSQPMGFCGWAKRGLPQALIAHGVLGLGSEGVSPQALTTHGVLGSPRLPQHSAMLCGATSCPVGGCGCRGPQKKGTSASEQKRRHGTDWACHCWYIHANSAGDPPPRTAGPTISAKRPSLAGAAPGRPPAAPPPAAGTGPVGSDRPWHTRLAGAGPRALWGRR